MERNQPKFIWSANENGLAVRFSSARRFQKARKGQGDNADLFAYIRMQMLVEPGDLDVEWVDNGIFLAAPDAVRLDPETREGFHLPPSWPGGFRMQTESVPHEADFRVRIALVDATAYPHWNWRLRGPILEAAGENFLPSAEQYVALKALTDWRQIEERDEFANLSLLASLREAWRAGCRIDLETYRDHPIVEPVDISVDVRKDENGDLVLRPAFEGDFPAPEPDEIEQRYGQLEQEGDRAILRVGSTIILLKPDQTRIARAIAKRGRVARSQKKEFEKNPSKWLADHVFPDEDAEFSPRVKGIDAWTPGYLGAGWEESEDWFPKKAGSPPSAREPTPGEEEKAPPLATGRFTRTRFRKTR